MSKKPKRGFGLSSLISGYKALEHQDTLLLPISKKRGFSGFVLLPKVRCSLAFMVCFSPMGLASCFWRACVWIGLMND